MRNHPSESVLQSSEAARELRKRARIEIEGALAKLTNAAVILAKRPDGWALGYHFTAELSDGTELIRQAFRRLRESLGEGVS